MARRLSKGAQVVRNAGGITLAKFKSEVATSREFQQLAKSYAAANGISEEAAKRSTSKFTKQYLRTFYRNGVAIDPKAKGLTRPNSRLARLLVQSGAREPGQPYAVGDTPKKG